jgi:hypothetical protein
MAQSKAETLMASYASLTAPERQQFRDMLAGYALRDQPAAARDSKKTKKTAAGKEAEAAKA